MTFLQHGRTNAKHGVVERCTAGSNTLMRCASDAGACWCWCLVLECGPRPKGSKGTQRYQPSDPQISQSASHAPASLPWFRHLSKQGLFELYQNLFIS